MAYGGPEYWDVIYRAVGDFADLITEAAKAKAALSSLSDTAKAEGDTEALAAAKAAAAHKADTAAINDERNALLALAAAAKTANVQTLYGGRSDMSTHLTDLQRQLELDTLINRQEWLGFSTPQAAYSWKQLELMQAYLMNRAKYGATSAGTGYTTPDQYLAYLQREYTAYAQENAVLLARAGVYKQNADAMLAYANALRGAHETFGTLGSSSEAAAQQIGAVVAGVPTEVTTKFTVDDAAAIARLAAYNALLHGVPREVSTTEVINAAYGMGGIPLDQPPQVIRVSYGGPYAEQFAAIWAEIEALAKASVVIPAKADVAPAEAEVKAWEAKVSDEPVTVPVVMAGGAAGGGGGPPPDKPAAAAAPDPGDAAAWNAVASAEGNAGDEATIAAAKMAVLNAVAAGDATSAAKLAYAYQQLGGAAKDAGDGTALVVPKLASAATAATAAGGAFGFLQRNFTLFGGAFGTTAIIGTITGLVLVLHLVVETLLVLVPALAALVAGFAAVGIWGAIAADAAIRVYNQFQALNAVSSAFGQNLPPITNELHNLEAAARPQVFEALGAVLNEAGQQGNIFSTIVAKVGNYVDTYLIRVLDWFNGPGKGYLTDFLRIGSQDLSVFGNILLNIGRAFEPLVRAGAITKVAETLLQGLAVALGYVAEAMKAVPTWALVFAIAGHSIVTYGGLAVTALQGAARAVLGFTGNIPGLQRVSADLASSLGATNEELAAMKANTPELEQLATAIAAGDTAAVKMAKDMGLTSQGLIQVVAKDPQIKQVADSFGLTAEQVAQTQIALVAADKSASEWAATSKNATDEVKAGLADVSATSGETAANMASLGVIASKSGSQAQEGVAAYTSAMAEAEAATAATTKTVSLLPGAVSAYAAAFTGADEATAGMVADTSLLGKAMAGVQGVMSGVVGFLASNWIIVAAAAAAAALYLNYSFQQVTQSTKNYLSTAKSALSNDTTTQGLQAAAQQLGQLQSQINGYGKQIQSAGGFWTQFVANFKSGGNTISFIMKSLGISQMQNSIHALNQQEETDLHDVGNVATTVSYTMQNFGLTSAQALGLMDVAGVKLSDSLTVMEQKVSDLVAGWSLMAIKGGILYNSVNAVTFATDQQNSSISKITGGWDAFFQLVSTAPNDFLTFQQDLLTMATDAKASGATMTGLSANSLTLQQSFIAAAQGGQTLLDQLMQQVSVGMQGVQGTNLLTQATKDLLAEMLPAASQSQTLTTILYALAQQGGYTGADSFKQLSAWVQTGAQSMTKAGGPAQQLQQLIQQAAGSVGDLATDVKNLDDAVNNQLIQVMTNAKLALSPGLTGALEAVGRDVQQTRQQLQQGFDFPPSMLRDAGTLATILEGIVGNKTQAAQYFETWATNMGLTTQQAQALWDDVTGASGAVGDAYTNTSRLHGVLNQASSAAADMASNTDKSNAKANTLKGTWQNLLQNVAQFASKWITGFDTGMSTIRKDINQIGSWFASLFSSSGGGTAGRDISGGIKGAFQVGLQFAQDLIKGSLTIILNLFDLFFNVLGGHWKAAWQNIVNIGLALWNDLVKPLWNIFNQGAVQPITKFFSATLPASVKAFGQQWTANVKQAWDAFNSSVVQPVGKWFNSTITASIIQFGRQWLTNVKQMWDQFSSSVISPVGKFFTGTIPGWFDGFVKNAKGAWDSAWSWFKSAIINPISDFFTKTIPGVFNSILVAWENAWIGAWNWLVGHVMDPILNFFTNTLPNAIGSILSKVGGLGSKILGALGLAGGGPVAAYPGGGSVSSAQAMHGSVPGAGDADSQVVSVMPGEWVLRKPARMALQAHFGPEFLPWLNYADRWLGSGSRGIAASQPGGHAMGGPIRAFAAGGWVYPAPAGLHAYDVTDAGYRLTWNQVTGPGGQRPATYTVETFQMNGTLADKFTTSTGSHDTAEYGFGGKGLHPGWEYKTWVWANGGPQAPPHAQMLVTLMQPPAATSGPPSAASSGGGPFNTVSVPVPVVPAGSSSSGSSGSGSTAVTVQVPDGSGGWMTVTFPSADALNSFYSAVGVSGGSYPSGLNFGSLAAAVQGEGGSIAGEVTVQVPDGTGGWMTASFPSSAALNNFYNAAGVVGGAYPDGLSFSQIAGDIAAAGGAYATNTGGPVGRLPVFVAPGPAPNLAPYVTAGAPAVPAFAGGGLAAVAGMFGGVAPRAPQMAAGGVVPSWGRQGTTPEELPRSLSDAAAGTGGQRVGLQVMGDVNITNPRAEKPSESITRASNRLAFLAGRLPV